MIPPVVGLGGDRRNSPKMCVRAQVTRLLSVSKARSACSGADPGRDGPGKGLLRSDHRLSHRANGPSSRQCGAIPETLLEAEMFASSVARSRGTQAKLTFQVAHRGTIFLDEIALLRRVQSKLLKAIEDREVRRLAARGAEAVDVWIIAGARISRMPGRAPFPRALYHGFVVTLSYRRARGGDASCCSLITSSNSLLNTECR